ncbi:MAG: glycosyltransferase [Candidatus Scalindua sp.]|jgi:glycosyltransferase involved in cell wall biosynthesis|nr:glycosyltransferase [Candidatus Scalindua sp.]
MYMLVKHLDKYRYTPFVATPGEGELADEIRKLGVNVFALSFPRIRPLNIFKIIIALTRLVKNIRTYNIDLIHTDAPREALFAGIAGKLLRVPVICHLRVSDSNIWLDKILYRFVDCFIAVSHAVTHRFSDIDNKNKIHVIYNGVELDKFIVLAVERPASCLKVGYFGRIDKRKGIDVLINAIKLLKKNVELFIMGDGDDEHREELERMAEGTRTVFESYKQNILADMSSVDVIVLPSYYGEGLSRVIIESFALGKVIIVSDLPENLEALGEQFQEFVFPVGVSYKLMEILKNISANKSILDERKDDLRSRAEKYFDIRRNTRQIENVYDRLVTSNSFPL